MKTHRVILTADEVMAALVEYAYARKLNRSEPCHTGKVTTMVIVANGEVEQARVEVELPEDAENN